MPAKTAESTYGIGAVAKLTGLTDHTIRVWERRYEAVVARRAANGRRVYEAADVEKLRLLKFLTDKGLSIGSIATCSVAELRERSGSLDEIVAAPMPDNVSVAVLGEVLPGRLLAKAGLSTPLNVVVADDNEERFKADLLRHSVDVVVLERAVFDSTTTERLRDLMARCNASHGILVYGFGRSADVELARRSNIVVLRSPIDVDELAAAVRRVYSSKTTDSTRATDNRARDAGPECWEFDDSPAPRRFTQQQLARLAGISSTIECECPQHLAQLVGELSAFEIYSAQCANRDDDDAALHRYLQQTTAKARALVEVALERVAEAEGLEV